mmetsp:Transcript_19461/g.30461  ORF Transcript_19461/g.30461 Transcript_19461/m.30461 type:complete len:124 (-) Transcript_19461:395-766(-)
MGKLEDAVAAHNEALAIRIKALGAEHPDVAKSLGKIAMYHREKGEHSCALVTQSNSSVGATKTCAYLQVMFLLAGTGIARGSDLGKGFRSWSSGCSCFQIICGTNVQGAESPSRCNGGVSSST